jgi:hypothetical protein
VSLLACTGVLEVAAALLVRVSWPNPVMTALGVILALALGLSGVFYILFALWLLVRGRAPGAGRALVLGLDLPGGSAGGRAIRTKGASCGSGPRSRGAPRVIDPAAPGACPARACAVGRVRLPGLRMRESGYPEEFLCVYGDFFTCRKKFS